MRKKRYPFLERVYTFPGSREYERIRTGRPPDHGKRKERKKPTAEQIKKQNQYNREKHLRRLIKANFKKNDYWITLTYPKGNRGTMQEVLADRKKFLDHLRKSYKKAGYELKWIGRAEVSKRGALHHHMIINRIQDGDTMISAAWAKVKGSGKVHFEHLYEKGQYRELAAYIVKPDKEDEKGNLTTQSNVSHSRKNLIIPEPEVKRTTLKAIVTYPEPSPGYYIDKDSVCQGKNPVTGKEYIHYIEIKLDDGGG